MPTINEFQNNVANKIPMICTPATTDAAMMSGTFNLARGGGTALALTVEYQLSDNNAKTICTELSATANIKEDTVQCGFKLCRGVYIV